jgi:transcriptional regulator with GAF, ATPase, and Fis domain
MARTFDKEPEKTSISTPYERLRDLRLRKCKLIREDPDKGTIEYLFDQPVIHIGTRADNEVVLEGPSVSRRHCCIVLDGDQYLLKDLDSTNGTYLNRIQIREAYLTPGCTLNIGAVDLRFQTEEEYFRFEPSTRDVCGHAVGTSERMREIFGIIEQVAPTNTTVVLGGETGTGKEVVARTLHQLSQRSKMPFVVVDCGAIPEHLIESELFGHERGAFTGALAARQGLFELASGGTIFLDEIGELRPELQPKMLRVLEQREIRRVGGNKAIKVDVRVLAATNRNLLQEVKAGRFREDLYYRLTVVHIPLPPLRERAEDIPMLAKHFLRVGLFNRDHDDKMRIRRIESDAIDALLNYEWPGNVRELQNVIERACSLTRSESIGRRDLPEHVSGVRLVHAEKAHLEAPPSVEPVLDQAFKDAKEVWNSQFEKAYLTEIIARHKGNITRAAKDAGLDRKHLRRLLKKHNLHNSDG